jgi:uncharacterized membrane protein YiaA
MDTPMAKSNNQTSINLRTNMQMFYVVVLMLPLGLRFFQWSWINIGFVSMALIFALIGFDYVQREAQKELRLQEQQQALISTYRLIKVLVMQGQSPYQALVTILPFVDRTIADAFHQLILHIDQDKSLTPYLDFANQFHSLMIEQLFFALYQLENQGGDARHFQQFQYLFDQAEQQHYQEAMQAFHETMQQQNQWVMVATGLIAIGLLLGVMTLIGGLIHGV